MVRLVTLSRLSLLREDCCRRAIPGSVLDALSTVTTTFDCHLLQRSAGNRPLDVLGTSEQQRRLQTAAADRFITVQVVTPDESVGLQFPNWVNVSIQTQAEPEAVTRWLSRPVIGSLAALDWLHVELPDAADHWQWIEVSLRAAADAADCCGTTLIVTATDGETEDPGQFESLLWEDRIRVPLWIRDGAAGCRRVSRPTGSFDVLETVLSSLGIGAASSPVGASLDLRSLHGGYGPDESRSIRISREGCEAVRTRDFLFVRTQSGEFGEKTALYGKPYDVWNVHDLSHEFPDVADDLSVLLSKEPV